MNRQNALVWLSVVGAMLITTEVHGQFGERINILRSSQEPAPAAKRRIAKIVVTANERARLLKALTVAINDVESLPDPQQRVGALTNLACAHTLLGDAQAAKVIVEKAKSVLGELPGDSTKAFSLISMAGQLAEYGLKDQARETIAAVTALVKQIDAVHQIRLVGSIAATQAILSEEVGATQALDMALEALVKMTNEAQWQQSLSMTVNGFISVGNFERALDIIEAVPPMANDLKRAQLQRVTYQLNNEAPEVARGVLQRATRIAKGLEDDTIRAQALSGIAVAHARSGDLIGAATIADDLVKKTRDSESRHAAVPIYIAIARAQLDSGDKTKAKENLAEALRLARAVHPKNKESQWQNIRTIAAIQAKYGDFAEALKTAQLIESDATYKSLALSEIATAKIVAKDKAGAMADFRKAFELLVPAAGKPEPNAADPNQLQQYRQQQAMYDAACGLAAGHEFAEATKNARRVLEFVPNPQPYYLYQALAQIALERAWTGDIDGAIKTADEIEEEWARSNALERIMSLEAEAGAVTPACDWITKQDDPQLRLRMLWAVVGGIRKRSENPSKDLPDLRQLKPQGIVK